MAILSKPFSASTINQQWFNETATYLFTLSSCHRTTIWLYNTDGTIVGSGMTPAHTISFGNLYLTTLADFGGGGGIGGGGDGGI